MRRWTLPVAAALAFATVAGMASDPPAAMGLAGSASSSSAAQDWATPGGPGLAAAPRFSLASPLAHSPAAQAFITERLAEWKLEKASIRLLAEGRGRYYCEQMQATLADIKLDLRLAKAGRGEDPVDWISNPEFDFLTTMENPLLFASLESLLPAILETWQKQQDQYQRYLELLGVFVYDEQTFALVPLLNQPKTFSLFLEECESTQALFRATGTAAIAPSQVLAKVKTLLQLGEALGDLNGFVIDWLRGQKGRFERDLQRLRTLPSAGPALERDSRVETKVVEAEPEVEVVEEEPIAEAAAAGPREERKETPAGGGAGAAGSGSPRFQDFYRFVACAAAPRPVTAAFRVGKGAARIREEVEARSPHLTSAKVVRLVQALEVYGARCEGNRKKGIMIKLPTGQADQPFVAKFFHRSHASYDGFDCHAADALKQLFNLSVFTVDKFGTGSR